MSNADLQSNGILSKLSVQYLLVLVLCLVLYTVTCAPTVLWQDSGLFVYRIWHNDIEGNLGIALSHPLYIMVGMLFKAIPLGGVAWRVNMVSAVFGAVAIANLYLLLRLWLENVWPAVIGAVSLAVSWTFWQHAVLAETYTLYAAQLFTELLVLLQYCRTKRGGYLYLLGFLNGLAIANHLWGIFPLACYGVYILILLFRKQATIKVLIGFVLLWVIGAAPYEYLIIRDIIANGDVAATIRSALFGNGWQSRVLNASLSIKIVLENVVFVLLNFPTPNIILLFAGLFFVNKRTSLKSFTAILISMSIMFFVFAFRYTVPDRHAFFVPFYCIAALILGVGADWFFSKYKAFNLKVIILLMALVPVGLYFITPEIARKYYPSLAQRRQRPYRDEYKYWLAPWKTGDDGAERFATEALESAGANAVIYAYTTDVHALLYLQEVKGKRPDVKIISDYDCSEGAKVLDDTVASALVSEGKLYVTSADKNYYPGFLDDKYDFVQSGHLWQVIEKR